MSNMKFVIEPSLLALDEECTEKEFKDYLKRVTGWERWMAKHPNDVYILSSTEAILSKALKYPVYPTFEILLEKYKINYIKACDLNLTISKLLKAPKIDKVDNVSVSKDAIVNSVILRTDTDGKIIKEGEAGALHELLWHVYCRITTQKDSPDTYLIFAKNLSDNVNLKVEYLTIEEGKEDFVCHEDKVSIRCHSSMKDFFKVVTTPDRILSNVVQKEDLALAIRVSVYQKGRLKKWAEAIDDYDFYIQDSFFKDYRDAHYNSNSTIKNRLMEEMSNVLLNEHLSNREDWRIDKGANSGQEIKNGYLAWRWFITQSVKMMYWQKDKMYKFANVKEHDIFVCQWEN